MIAMMKNAKAHRSRGHLTGLRKSRLQLQGTKSKAGASVGIGNRGLSNEITLMHR
jgi:hypothetical protein